MAHDQNKKTLRSFQCRDYLWEIFEQMGGELECSVDYLINEAMRQYARSRNYGVRSPSTPGMPRPPGATPPAAVAAAPQAGAGIPSLGQSGAPRPPIPSAPPPPPQRPAAPAPGYGQAPAPAPPAPGYGQAPGAYPTPGQGVAQPQAGYPQAGPPGYPPAGGGYPQAGPPGYPPAPQAAPLQRPASFPPGPPTQRPPAPPGGVPPQQGYPPAPAQSAPPPLPGAPRMTAAGPGFAAAPQARPTLFVIFNGQKMPVAKDEFVIGRGSKTADLPIKDGNISRRHAAVVFQAGAFYMKDLGSTNGVEFNGARIDSKQIAEGDIYHICDYELRFTYR